MDILNDLYKICDTLGDALTETNGKIRDAGGKISSSDLEYVDRLTHAIKSVKTSIAMIEAEDEGGSYNDGSYRRYYRTGGSDGYSRTRNAMRDSNGRYSNRGYSRDGYSNRGDMMDELRTLMDQAPDDQTRHEFQRLIQKMEQR